MKVLIIINQLFQLMVAAHLRETLLKDCSVDLFLVNTSAGIKTAFDNIQSTNMFDKCILINNTRDSKIGYVFTVAKNVLSANCDCSHTYGIELSEKYEAIFFNEYSIFTCLLLLELNANKRTPALHFEEGYGSYLGEFGTHSRNHILTLKLWHRALHLLKRPALLNIVRGHFYFFPQLVQYKSAYKTYQIPHFDMYDHRFREFVTLAYSIPKENEFDRKYIFFEENIQNGDIDDYSLIMSIANRVGRENLMVKLHPRRTVDRFSKHGIKVSTATGIPWEALLMKFDFSDKVLMTISSGVAFSSRLYFGQAIPTFMLFNLFHKMNSGVGSKSKFFSYVDGFRGQFGDENFYMPKSYDEFWYSLCNSGD